MLIEYVQLQPLTASQHHQTRAISGPPFSLRKMGAGNVSAQPIDPS